MDNNKIGIAILVGLGLLGFIFFMARNGVPMPTPAPPSHNGGHVGQPLRLMPAGNSRQYSNKEVWSIVWNADGLPEKVEIERHATQT